MGDQKAFASSIARIDPITVITDKLRPMGICTQNTHLVEWFSYLNGTMQPSVYNLLRGAGPTHPVYPGTGVVHRVMYTKEQPNACGESPGNWGFVDFDGGSNGTGDIRSWIKDGYKTHSIEVDDCNADNTTPSEWCPANTGAISGSIESALTGIIGVSFPLPLFDQARGSGSGTDYHVVGFLGVTLRGFEVSGAEADRYFDLEFTTLMGKGRCCTKPGAGMQDGGVRVVRLCSVDHDPISETTRCR